MKPERVEVGDAVLFLGDAFDVLPKLDTQSDAIISDPPYGLTDCDWDDAIPLDKFWAMVESRMKPSANVVLFGCGKFSVALVNSKPKWYRYDLIWQKNKKCGFLNAGLMPMRSHEQVLVFGQPGFLRETTYNAQKVSGGRAGVKTTNHRSNIYGFKGNYVHHHDGTQHPGSILHFKHDRDNAAKHPTRKPLALMEFLIRSYTNENDIVVDLFCGSGTTGVAAINAGRRFIGIEREKKYFDIAVQRVEEAYAALDEH